jgi:hypothetical protein
MKTCSRSTTPPPPANPYINVVIAPPPPAGFRATRTVSAGAGSAGPPKRVLTTAASLDGAGTRPAECAWMAFAATVALPNGAPGEMAAVCAAMRAPGCVATASRITAEGEGATAAAGQTVAASPGRAQRPCNARALRDVFPQDRRARPTLRGLSAARLQRTSKRRIRRL